MLLLGLLTLMAGLLTPRVVIWGLESRALWVEGEMPLALSHVLEVAIRDLTLLLFRRSLYVGGALSVIGLLLMLVSPLFPGRRRSRSSPAARWTE